MSLEINGEVIEDEIIDHEFNYIKKKYQSPINSRIDDKELLTLVKENLTRKTLLRQEADKLTITVNPEEIKEEINKYKQTHPNTSSADEEKLRQYFTQQYRINHLINQVIQDIEKPQDKHLKIFFQENQEKYFLKKAFDFIEIGVGKEKSQSLSEKALKDKITSLQKNFVHDKNYQEKVKAQLGPTSYTKEWRLFPEKNLNPLIKEKLNLLDEKKTTSIQEEKSAFYFLYLENVYSNYQPLLTEMKTQVYQDLVFELEEIKIDIYVQKLMEKGKVIDNTFM